MKKIVAFILVFSYSMFGSILGTAWAQSGFLVHTIQIKGLHRLSASTVESYLPIKRGEVFSASKSSLVVKELYKTGFFDHIAVSQAGNTLVIDVVERPTIGQLKVTGNSVIPTDRLTAVMKSLDIAEGRVYNPLVLERIKQSLLNQYLQQSHYNARVDITTSKLTRNRLLVTITISEGDVAKIKHIAIQGNQAFSESVLIKQSELSTWGLFTYFTQTDHYSEQRVEAAVEKIRNYYLDHGYLRAEVKALPPKMSANRQSVDIAFHVSEGQIYTVSDVVVAGELKIPAAEARQLINIKSGDVFSREKIITSEKAITKAYGRKGYLFAGINLNPLLNDSTHQVKLNFEIVSGKRTYIRHVTFSDNTRTDDVVLRREVTQMEAAPASATNLEESKHRLSLLPFIKDVDMSVNPVPGTADQVDANFKVKEDNSAQATFKLGYSQLYGPILGLGLNQKNVFGTGNTLGLNFQHSKFEQNYGIDYTDPYYTMDGISRSLNLSVSRVDPGSVAGVNSGYTANEYDAGVMYGFPLGQEDGVYNRLLAGVGYQNTLIKLRSDTSKISNQINSFVNQHGRHFQELDLKVGLSRDSRDKAIFPTSGATQGMAVDVYAPLGTNSLLFYTLTYHGKWYLPLSEQFIVMNRADFGYGMGSHGASSYPFFKNFYAGGMDSVRGYSGYTLGAKDSNGQAFGGNLLADASVGLIFPNYISDNLRTMAFADAGNVYSALDQTVFGGVSRNSGGFRYALGLEVDLMTPLGPIQLSFSKAINPYLGKPHGAANGDETKWFDFALGASF